MRTYFLAASGMFVLILLFVFLEANVFKNSFKRPLSALSSPADNTNAEFSLMKKNATENVLSDRFNQWGAVLVTTSLAGSRVDRPHMIREAGDNILTPAILLYFDYFLSLSGELPEVIIHEMVIEDIKKNYPSHVASILKDLFWRYCDYLLAMKNRLDNLSYADVFWFNVTHFDVERETQLQFFTEIEVEALFDAYKTALSKKSKASDYDTKYEIVNKLDVSYNEKIAAVSEYFGEEAVVRMEGFYQQELKWNERLNDFEDERQAIEEAGGLDVFAKQQAIRLLLERSFNESERIRVITIIGGLRN